MKTPAQAKMTPSMYAVLGLLSWGPMSGYEMRKIGEISIRHFWREGYGQIYPSLRKLEAAGMVSRRTESGEGGRPDRHVYMIEEPGRQALGAWMGIAPKADVARDELLLKLFFGKRTPVETSIRHIEERRALHERLLAEYAATEHDIKAQHAGNEDLPYWLMTLSNGRHVSRAMLAWCDETLETLKGITQNGKGGNDNAGDESK